MVQIDRKSDNGCGETEKIANILAKDFQNKGARIHLASCVSCRNDLAESRGDISRLARTVRNGIACSG